MKKIGRRTLSATKKKMSVEEAMENKGKNRRKNQENKDRENRIGEKVKELVWGWIKDGKKWLGY